MKIPAPLRKGDRIAIVAPARKVEARELNFAVNLLRSWDLEPVLGTSIGREHHQFAGTDQERAADFQQQLNDSSIKGIWCARGGYGSVRIVDRLDFSGFEKKPKWIIGYSDVTAIHASLQIMGIAGIHAEMPVLIDSKTQETADTLKAILFGAKPQYTWKNATEFKREGKAEGVIVGGNLSVLYSLCGSDSALDPSGKILFIEDLDEYLYHIDRMMQNLKRNHWFDNLKGLIVGGMNAMNDNSIPFGQTAEEIIWEVVKEYDFPVGFGFPAGHLIDNYALIFGEKIELGIEPNQNLLQYI